MSKTLGPFNPFQHNIDSGEWNELTKAYKNNPSIELYVKMRRRYPKALIEISTSWLIDWLFSNSDRLEGFGINPRIVAGCLDSDPEDISELSLLLMENLILRRKLIAEGEHHTQSRSEIMPDGLINYLICMMLDALDWNDDLYIHRDLIALIKHQFDSDVSMEAKHQEMREKRNAAVMYAAAQRAKGDKCSRRDVAKLMGVSPSSASRWFQNTSFDEEVAKFIDIFDENGESKIGKLWRETRR